MSEHPPLRNPFTAVDRHTSDASMRFRERFFQQEPILLAAANRLASVIRGIPPSPQFPNIHPRALAVGGFVRDTVLGLHPKDLDMEVYGMPFDRIKHLLEQLFPGKVNLVGESFLIMKVALGNGCDLDVSIPRRDSKKDGGRNAFKITGDPSMSIEEAAMRRDFTMNSLAADLLTGELVDPFGGVKDLENRILRVTDENTFQDDALRVYRAMQFVGRMDLTVDPGSLALMRQMVDRWDLNTIAPERVAEEFKKLLLKSNRPSLGLAFLDQIGAIDMHYEDLAALKGTPQEEEWHPEGDVWQHTAMVVDQAALISQRPEWGFNEEERLMVMMGALCHDLGKPSTTIREDGRIRSRGHEEAGAAPTEALLRRLPFSQKISHATITIAKEHLKPDMLYRAREAGRLTDKSYANAVRKFLKRTHPAPWRVLIAASEADFRGRGIPGVATKPYLAGRRFTETILAQKLDKAATTHLLRGDDLLALGFKPGKEMGKVIKAVEALRDQGDLSTYEEALEYARQQSGG